MRITRRRRGILFSAVGASQGSPQRAELQGEQLEAEEALQLHVLVCQLGLEGLVEVEGELVMQEDDRLQLLVVLA
jgi:hypothetical protein